MPIRPVPLGRLDDKPLLDRGDRDADVAHFAAGEKRLHALKVRVEFALGDRRDVRADTAELLLLT